MSQHDAKPVSPAPVQHPRKEMYQTVYETSLLQEGLERGVNFTPVGGIRSASYGDPALKMVWYISLTGSQRYCSACSRLSLPTGISAGGWMGMHSSGT